VASCGGGGSGGGGELVCVRACECGIGRHDVHKESERQVETVCRVSFPVESDENRNVDQTIHGPELRVEVAPMKNQKNKLKKKKKTGDVRLHLAKRV
jgi:hypothetical protein